MNDYRGTGRKGAPRARAIAAYREGPVKERRSTPGACARGRHFGNELRAFDGVDGGKAESAWAERRPEATAVACRSSRRPRAVSRELMRSRLVETLDAVRGGAQAHNRRRRERCKLVEEPALFGKVKRLPLRAARRSGGCRHRRRVLRHLRCRHRAEYPDGLVAQRPRCRQHRHALTRMFPLPGSTGAEADLVNRVPRRRRFVNALNLALDRGGASRGGARANGGPATRRKTLRHAANSVPDSPLSGSFQRWPPLRTRGSLLVSPGARFTVSPDTWPRHRWL